MICCSNCGHVVSLPTPVRDPACRCRPGQDALDADGPADNGYQPIARFANAAEAGYFAHELAHQLEFEPVVRSEQDFDAIGGSWRHAYLLCAPEPLADSAAALLHEMCGEEDDHSRLALRESESGRFDHLSGEHDASWEQPSAARRSHFPWASLLLTVAAGSVAFWSGRHAGRPAMAVDPRRQEALLKELLATPERPWQQRLGRQGGVRQLTLTRDRQAVLLQEDRDGDGLFELERRFVLHGE
ncbi:hypothetical protein Mal4_07570 [Maioricimonas rarisocia]|uniref:Uncharacterized protein n=1 Tax=Maioricimonas rarisocia TaxID=2528026 RepID=A0A517Z1W5_9PLAN|nr:hypothetical protein [Maioricimonas rarisocia]QDU36471.1 hypothetical protein Mal4_07570 [Maioricimonas rarisocia]